LLGVVSALWLAKAVDLMVVNATCCLLAADNDGQRGLFFAMIALGLQLATLAVAIAVVAHRAQRTALAALILYIAIGGVLLTDNGANVQLRLNLVALVIAGLAVAAELLVARHRSRLEL